MLHSGAQPFQPGKAPVPHDGEHLAIMANGMVVHQALAAAKRLATEGIVNGRQLPRLTATELFRLSGHLPLGWPQQRKLVGFANDKTARA